MLRAMLEFLEAPDRIRVKANASFVANERSRSRAFFDRIEARPLTDEQRRAVVVDEGRNLRLPDTVRRDVSSTIKQLHARPSKFPSV